MIYSQAGNISCTFVCFPVLTFLGKQLKQIPGGLKILNHIKSTEASYYWHHFLKMGGQICFLSMFCPSVDSISLRWRLQSEKHQLRTARLCPETCNIISSDSDQSHIWVPERRIWPRCGPECHVLSVHCAQITISKKILWERRGRRGNCQWEDILHS